MKKIEIIILIFFMFILVSCNDNETTKNIQAINIRVDDNIQVEVNPRIELLTTIQYLADYDLLTHFDLDYKKDIDEYFKEYKDHKAVSEYKELAKKGFIVDDPIVYILNCTPLPGLEISENMTYSQDLLITGVKDINKFRESIQEFYYETNFKEFYNNNQELYQEILSSYTKDSDTIKHYVDKLEEYTGKKQKSYNIILSPLLNQGTYGPSLNEENDRYDSYFIGGPYVSKEVYEKFDKDIEKIKSYKDVLSTWELSKLALIHEFAHTHLRSMEKAPYLSMITNEFVEIEESFREEYVEHYNTLESIVNEYFVRAITSRILILEDEIEDYEMITNQNKVSGFEHIEKLTEKLKEYENNRDKYKKIEDFYPELLEELVKQYN